MPKLNIKALKKKLTLEDHKKLMKALDIPAYSESDSTIVYWTGDRNRNALNGSPKLYWYKDSMTYFGYTSSRSYDIISLVQTRLALLGQPSSFQDAIAFITETCSIEMDAVKRIDRPHVYDWQSSLDKFIRFQSTGSTLTPYDKSILDQLNHVYPQSWIDEGISVETMEKYGIGYYERTQSTTIPCFNAEGELIGIRVRNWNPEDVEEGRKYIPLMLLDGTTFKFPTNNVFFGVNWNKPKIEQSGTVILAEAEKSVMKLDTIYGENNVALAMYGKNLGTNRRNQLIKMGVDKVIYVPDNDYIGLGQEAYDKWEQEVLRFGKQFKGYASVEVVWDNLGLLGPKDNATDGGPEIWDKLYEARETM